MPPLDDNWSEGDHPRDEHGRFATASKASEHARRVGTAEAHLEARDAHRAAAEVAEDLDSKREHVEAAQFHAHKAASLGKAGSAREAHNKRKSRESVMKKLGKVGHQIVARDGHACVYCHGTEKSSGKRLTLDHITPRHKGGLDTAKNLVTACHTCNSQKRAMSVAEFAKHRSDLSFDATAIRAQARRRLPELSPGWKVKKQ